MTTNNMTVAEAHSLLTSIGYREDWTLDQLIAATPGDMIERVLLAMSVSAEAAQAEANALKAYIASRGDR